MKYLSTLECAKKWGISQRRVSLLCSQGRIYGALKTGNTWIIPEFAVKPFDERTSKDKENKGCEAIEGYEICEDYDGFEVREQSVAYDYQLAIDPGLFKKAADYFATKGETISDAINQFLYESITRDKKRIGIAKNLFEAPENIDFCNDEVSALFGE